MENMILDEETGVFRSEVVQNHDNCVRQNVDEKGSRCPTRKRVRRTKDWQRNIRQKLHQSGEAYTSSRGKEVPKKSLKIKRTVLPLASDSILDQDNPDLDNLDQDNLDQDNFNQDDQASPSNVSEKTESTKSQKESSVPRKKKTTHSIKIC
ncbi:unnamed protein product [Diatraea saccharalis]|uniref:Uncharacterized protein n=1 Tax=Diatraea saccharalis TaxID=40085 RepID=A0A9N9RB18_9NEOP|nr:unnamed protein product [Diatraea saccharalis]